MNGIFLLYLSRVSCFNMENILQSTMLIHSFLPILFHFTNSCISQTNTSNKNLSSTLPSSPLIIMIVVVVVIVVVPLLSPSISILPFPIPIIIMMLIGMAAILLNRITNIQKIRSDCKGLQITKNLDPNMQRIRYSSSLPFLILLFLLMATLRFLRI